MRRLILFRHAKSSWGNDRLEDHVRPLSARGETDAPRMAKRLQRRDIDPDVILTSSATRAKTTAKLIAETLHGNEDRVRVVSELYLALPSMILEVVAGQSDAVSEIIVVAHNPGLTELASRLVPDLELANLPTAGVVAIDFASDSWKALKPAEAAIKFYDYPKNPDPDASA